MKYLISEEELNKIYAWGKEFADIVKSKQEVEEMIEGEVDYYLYRDFTRYFYGWKLNNPGVKQKVKIYIEVQK